MKRYEWVVTALWMAASAGCLGGQEQVNVVVFDSVGVQQGDMESTLELAGRFFQRLNVEAKWIVCRSLESCPMPPEGTFVRVSVVGWSKGTILGFANMQAAALGNPQVYVFHDTVSRAAAKSSLARVLAYVMVHEMLHSLGLKHSPHGIMRETVRSQELVDFLHSPAMPAYQLKELRDGLSRLSPAVVAARGN